MEKSSLADLMAYFHYRRKSLLAKLPSPFHALARGIIQAASPVHSICYTHHEFLALNRSSIFFTMRYLWTPPTGVTRMTNFNAVSTRFPPAWHIAYGSWMMVVRVISGVRARLAMQRHWAFIVFGYFMAKTGVRTWWAGL
jgi:hypothetical protein